MTKIMTGQLATPKIVAAIRDILDLHEEAANWRAEDEWTIWFIYHRTQKSRTPASDYMTSGELEAVVGMENRISVLLEIGMDYQQIKAGLERVPPMPRVKDLPES